MSKSTIKKIFIIYFSIVAVVFSMQLIYYVNVHFAKVRNHEKVEQILRYDLSYDWDNIDKQLEEIKALLETEDLTIEDMGRLYERASLIYLNKKMRSDYFKNISTALYYLKQSDDTDYTINIYLDLANFYLNNYANKEAENMIAAAEAIKPFDEIESLQIKAYAYRMQGIVAFLNLDYNEAETYFNDSQRIIELSSSNTFETQYTAMNDVWMARVYEETGRLSKCKEKLDKWADSDVFTTEVYRQINLRDFIIPYYQAKCYYLCAENIKERNNSSQMDTEAREQAVIDYLHEFLELCEENEYEKAELYTLLKIQKEYPTRNENIQRELITVLNELYSNTFKQQNFAYAAAVRSFIIAAQEDLRVNQQAWRKSIRRTKIAIISAMALTVVVLILIILFMSNRFDGLTHLLTRKVFDYDLAKIQKSNNEYGIIMIDIDDFKNVNDTYGHQSGDVVLWRLGQLIENETTSDIHAYRYGGEEFAIIVGKNALPYIKNIADRLCHAMFQQAWDFDSELLITLSIGTATGKGTENVVKMADDNLYYSKAHGKNRVTST